MKFPTPCPKGKHIFHRAVQIAACTCLHPHKKCRKIKRKANALLDEYVGGEHVRLSYHPVDNSVSANHSCGIFGLATAQKT